MMDRTKQSILFIINTEFGLYSSILYFEKFVDKSLTPIWLFFSTKNDRFKRDSYNQLPGEKYFFKDRFNKMDFFLDYSFVNCLKGKKINYLVHQNNFKISNLYIKSKIYHKGLKEIYISDGIGMNVKRNSLFFIRLNVILWVRKFFNGLHSLPLLVLPTKKYIEKVDLYINSSRFVDSKTPCLLFKDLFFEVDSSRLQKIIFNINFVDNYDIYLFTQPIETHDFSENSKKMYLFIIDKIIYLSNKFEKRVFIKVHPRENVSTYLKYENKFCYVSRDNHLPAEILFLSIANRVIISAFSSISLMDFSNRNEHYWFYPLIGLNLNISGSHKSLFVIDDIKILEKIFLS